MAFQLLAPCSLPRALFCLGTACLMGAPAFTRGTGSESGPGPGCSSQTDGVQRAESSASSSSGLLCSLASLPGSLLPSAAAPRCPKLFGRSSPQDWLRCSSSVSGWNSSLVPRVSNRHPWTTAATSLESWLESPGSARCGPTGRYAGFGANKRLTRPSGCSADKCTDRWAAFAFAGKAGRRAGALSKIPWGGSVPPWLCPSGNKL